MFGFGRGEPVNLKIDYKILAQEIDALQLHREHEVTENLKIPVGIYDDVDDLRAFKKLLDEEAGLESLLNDLLAKRADIAYRKHAFWDTITHKLGIDRSAQYNIHLTTGEVFKLRYGYEDLLIRLRANDAIKSDYGVS